MIAITCIDGVLRICVEEDVGRDLSPLEMTKLTDAIQLHVADAQLSAIKLDLQCVPNIHERRALPRSGSTIRL